MPYTESLSDWVRSENIVFDSNDYGRQPTLDEIRKSLVETGFDIAWEKSGSGTIYVLIDRPDGAWASLVIGEYSDEDSPCEFVFERGGDEIIHIVCNHISRKTGPLIVIPDTMDGVVVVDGEKTHRAENTDRST